MTEAWIYRTIFVVFFVGLLGLTLKAGRRLVSSTDFSLAGRRLQSTDVAWVIIGTLVGGAATIGTVQMAYLYGFAAWHFTLGSGLACLLLGLCFARGLRESASVTVAEYLGRHFGPAFRTYSSLLASAGMLMQVVAQFLAAKALLNAVFGFGDAPAVGLSALLILAMTVAGGLGGAGQVGRLKCYLLYLIMLLCAAAALQRSGGWGALWADVQRQGADFSIWSYGRGAALLDLLSMVIGVLSTQIYLQAVFAAQTVRQARRGALLSAVLIPPLGLLGVVVGLHLRVAYPALAAHTARALPFFLHEAFPAPLAALFAAGLLVVVLGTAAGLVLGVTTSLHNDLFGHIEALRRRWNSLTLIRTICLAVVGSAVVMVWLGLRTTILKWSYLSMGLRGTAVFAGLCLAVFGAGKEWRRPWRLLLFGLPIAYLVVFLR